MKCTTFFYLYQTAQRVIYINPSEGEIVAENNIGFNLISPAIACSCSEDGDVGQKYRVTKINIYTDTIFDNSIPIGEPLNELFEVVTQRTIYGIPTYALSLDEAPNHIYAFNLHRESSVIALTLKDKPSTKRPYKFKVELTKENGEMLFAETDYIEFD